MADSMYVGVILEKALALKILLVTSFGGVFQLKEFEYREN